jgi:Phage ABA sandwich domain
MTPTEQRELDAWIAEHVMGYRWTKIERRGKTNHLFPSEQFRFEPAVDNFNDNGGAPSFTTDPAAAMEVLKRCADKVTAEFGSLDIDGQGNSWLISAQMRGEFAADVEHETEAKTLELAICLFAKKLFTK